MRTTRSMDTRTTMTSRAMPPRCMLPPTTCCVHTIDINIDLYITINIITHCTKFTPHNTVTMPQIDIRSTLSGMPCTAPPRAPPAGAPARITDVPGRLVKCA